MSFNISNQQLPKKRLSRANARNSVKVSPEPISEDSESLNLPSDVKIKTFTNLNIANYSEKAIVVMGSTLEHSAALEKLGGKYNPSLRFGPGWIFSKVKEESVRNYIKTGEVKPHVYSESEKAKFSKTKTVIPTSTITSFKQLFVEMRGAFDSNQDYTGESIIDVINQLEEKYTKE